MTDQIDTIQKKKMKLLDISKEKSKLTFPNEVNSLEFVELIGDMDINYSVNYKKRDSYLKKLGQKLFKNNRQIKIKKRKLKINFSYDKKYISKKASKKKVKIFFRKLFNISIEINIKFLKFRCYSDRIDINETEILSQDEIDLLLTATSDENNKKEIKVMTQDEIDKILTKINDGSDSSDS